MKPFIVPVTFNGPKNASSSTISRRASYPNLVSTPGSQSTSSRAAETVDDNDEFSINMTHMRLLQNFSSQAFLAIETVGKGGIPTRIYYKHALTTPYIMHQCLASSALHLATESQESAAFYREYAAGLQHRALSLFNNAHPILEVTAENCENMFLWSSLVGVHVLCEAFIFQRESLKEFMDAFTNGMKLYRGVLTVIDQCSDLLLATETGSSLKHLGALLRATTSRDGPECETDADAECYAYVPRCSADISRRHT